MGYSGARGTLIDENNLKSKISCQTPFNPVCISLYTGTAGAMVLYLRALTLILKHGFVLVYQIGDLCYYRA
jgi:hypothetical protein